MLDFIFKPNSIAVIGASEDEKKIGHVVFRNLVKQGFEGKVYPVNPKREEILGIKCYPSVKDLPEKIDLAIIVIPAKGVPSVIKDCASAGVKGLIVITAGFREIGGEGIKLEQEIVELVKKYGIRMVGPNCLGVINTINKMNATFASELPPCGRVSFFSQSGALGVALIDWAIENNFGFGKFVSLGNKADLNETDFLEYFGEDPETDIILGYIEDIKDGKRFLEVAKKVSKIKPVIIIKAGTTEAGAKAASSHTGAFAGFDRAFSEAFKKAGIIRVNSIKELFETAEIFKLNKIPKGDRLLVITNAGGPGIIAADTADKLGIKLDPMSEESIEAIIDKLPPTASLYNPIDIIGDATSERYKVVLEQAIKDRYVDGICVILTPQAVTDVENVATEIVRISQNTEKPVFACFIGGKKVSSAIKILKSQQIPCYSDPSVAISSYKKLIDFSIIKNKKEPEIPKIEISLENKEKVRLILEILENAGVSSVGEENATEILSLYGFNFPKKALAKTPEEAVEIAEKIGYPVVLKVSSPNILHKTDVGGVKLNLKNAEEVYNAFVDITINVKRFMPNAYIKGVMVYEMITGGKEVILGVSYDTTFGHMLMFGLGGIYVEVLKDVSFRIAPLTKEEAYEMVEEIKGAKILEGVRGEPPYDKENIVDKILRLSQLVTDFPIIKEIDINPYVVKHQGGVALDARMIIGKL
ncbi:acetyl coenzyme A synthetase (ADP forming), alpha domain protein [Thermodesulfobacterium geofontis OPF15]|uniref:Acetyl coenzyme A synthetase (ADP forming), alpha domain protein n=1 Tax=Thermodesulfobacterium geofontis (strain OPF15) TaxID=795359 RepID=F8C4V1_THEGP|nr:acetate--CoA ligase [Thermodesulfobacterium geofontis]AEH22735.1 acetyl coenzyme A synthetase (ADP forming), alpha domain protein [Thermodesulfobacterium geofontis OPF15]